MKVLAKIIFASLFLVFVACDKVDDPFPPDLDAGEKEWDDSTESQPNTERYILLEEFTGHTCTNCPRAAAEIERLRNDKYGKKFIPIAIHATEAFAAPKEIKGAPAGSFTTDHRTDEGNDYENELAFGVGAGLPRGMVSRTKEAIVDTKWVQECDKIYNSGVPPVANINLKTYLHNPSGTFKVAVQIEWLQDYTGDMNLQIQVREDSIVDWQLDGSTYVPDYVFQHMFRGSVNTAWGSPLAAAKKGTVTDTSFSRSIEPYLGRKREKSLANFEKSNFDDFSVVAFIYKRSPDFEVMQVNEAYLTSAGGH